MGITHRSTASPSLPSSYGAPSPGPGFRSCYQRRWATGTSPAVSGSGREREAGSRKHEGDGDGRNIPTKTSTSSWDVIRQPAVVWSAGTPGRPFTSSPPFRFAVLEPVPRLFVPVAPCLGHPPPVCPPPSPALPRRLVLLLDGPTLHLRVSGRINAPFSQPGRKTSTQTRFVPQTAF